MPSVAAAEDYDTTELKAYPWPPTLPREFRTDKLTPADWVGPDGIVYPNWTWTGVHIGLPGQRVAGIPRIDDVFTTLPNSLAGEHNGPAFTDAIEAAVRDCGQAGGGVVQIPAGTFVLTRPLVISSHRVVIRGAGRGNAIEPGGRNDPAETRLQFNFALGTDGQPPVRAYPFPTDDRGAITRDTHLMFYAPAFSAQSSPLSHQNGGKASHINTLEIAVHPVGRPAFTTAFVRNANGADQYLKPQSFHPVGPTTGFSIPAERFRDELRGATRVGFRTKVVWKWKEKPAGSNQEVEREDAAVSPLVEFALDDFDAYLPDDRRLRMDSALTDAISFIGPAPRSFIGGNAPLLEAARRGDTSVRVDLKDVAAAAARNIRPDALVSVFVYNSTAFADAIERDGGGGTNRELLMSVADVRPHGRGGVEVVLEQPLQMDLPLNEGQVDVWDKEQGKYVRTGNRSSFISGRAGIRECGVEDLVLEQTARVWFNGIRMQNAMNCWVRNVRVERAGRDPISLHGTMNELRDAELIDPVWANNTGGGSAYLSGGSYTLIDNVYARNMRHAPNFTGGVAGVVRNSRFSSSDMQWHNEWGKHHLMENCTVDALLGTGSYGYGAFAQRNTTDIHGPGMGPRNVIYNCDLIGPVGGIFLGGKSEGPLVLHNRVRAWTGPGLVLRYHVFNGTFLGNVFALQNRFDPAVLFGEVDPAESRLHKTAERPKPLVHPKLGTANVGNDFLHNIIYGGSGKIADGPHQFDHVRAAWRRSEGNRVLPWDANPPRPQPAMASVFEAQRAKPEGYADELASKSDTLYPALAADAPDTAADDATRDDGTPVAQVNFQDERAEHGDKPAHWHGQPPYGGWAKDTGAAFGDRPDGGRFGWVGGKPHLVQDAVWSDQDFRYRTYASWRKPGDENDVSPFGQSTTNRDLTWQIQLPPGRYHVFLAAGSPRKPERFSWPDERPLPFKQVNEFLLNDVHVKDPDQSDVRRDAWWASVDVGPDGLLTLRPAATAIAPRVAFIQIYSADQVRASTSQGRVN